MLQIFLSWLIPFACGGAITFFVNFFFKFTKRERAERDGIQCLLRAEIIKQHEKYEGQGFCPLYVKESIKKEYDSYHDLGGNGIATRLYEDILKLPEKEDR